nr:DUF2809 domain-containing protein [uncultured Microbacterium sp.]
MHSPTRRRRLWLTCVAVAVIALGLTTHAVGDGPVADFTGDALYAVLVYLIVALVFPRARSAAIGLTAAALCSLIEVFQLTGLPSRWAEVFSPVRFMLGVGFDARDLLAYAVGAALATACDLAVRRRRADRRRSEG